MMIILKVLQTPGYTPDSLCLWYERDQILFTGATIQSSSGEDEEALHRSATLLQSTYRGRIGKRQTHERRAAAAPKITPKKKSLWGTLRGATSLLRSSSKQRLDDLPTPSKTNYRTARDHRARLVAYEKHDPSKISAVDAVLRSRGRRGVPLEIVKGHVRSHPSGGDGGASGAGARRRGFGSIEPVRSAGLA